MNEGIILGLGIGLILFLLFVLGIYGIFSIIGKWKMYEKAGVEGWRALIPFYSSWTLIEITGLKWYWFLIYILPYVIGILGNGEKFASIAAILSRLALVGICYNLSKKFKKGDTWFILSIFFGEITIPLLGYISKDKYYNDEKVDENAFLQSVFNSNNINNNNNNNNNNTNSNNNSAKSTRNTKSTKNTKGTKNNKNIK